MMELLGNDGVYDVSDRRERRDISFCFSLSGVGRLVPRRLLATTHYVYKYLYVFECMAKEVHWLGASVACTLAPLARAPAELIGAYVVEPQRVGIEPSPAHNVAHL